MTNVESMDYTHSHPSTIASLSSTVQLSPVPYTQLLPSSKQPPYLPIMTFPWPFEIYCHATSTIPFYYDTLHHCHCDKSSFVDSNITISASLPLENPFILYGFPIIGQVTKYHTLFSYMDPISDFMASSHFAESGLIIAS